DGGHPGSDARGAVPRGDLRLHLAAQLTAAALNMAAGGAPFGGFSDCDVICADPMAPDLAVSACINDTDAFNQSGDNIVAPFEPAGPADPSACGLAFDTACTLLQPSLCAVP